MIDVMLVGNETLVCEGLRRILDECAGIKVVGQAVGLGEGSEMARVLGPDVMVVDPTPPVRDHRQAPGQSHGPLGDPDYLLLARYEGNECVECQLRSGTCCRVDKRATVAELITAIRSVHQGICPIRKTCEEPPLRIPGKGGDGRNALDRLTSREREVMRLLEVGRTCREIAELLGLSYKTVNTHRMHILAKLGLRNNAELARFGVEHELVAV